jgi:hypothetical protein
VSQGYAGSGLSATLGPAVSAGTQSVASGTVVFSNSNGISFGMAGSQTVTASYTVPSTAGLLSNINVSAGTTSQNLSALTFSNSHGLAFGLNGSTLTGSYTVPTVPAQFSGGNSNLGNTAGDTGVVTGRLVLVGSNNITLSGSTNGGSMTISISGGAGGGGSLNVSAGTTSNNLTALTFSNANGISFGLNASTITASVATSLTNIRVSAGTTSNLLSALTFSNANGMSFGLDASTLTASYTVPTVTNSSWTVSDAASSETVARLAFTNLNGVTLSLSTGAGGSHTIIGSHNALTSQSNQAASGSNGSFTFQTLSFSNANGVSFGTSAGPAMTASYTVPTVTNSSWTVSDSVTSATVGRLAFTASNGLTLTLSTSNNGNHTVIGSYTRPVVSNAIASVGSATNSGTNTSRFAADDHVHAGVFSVGVSNVGNTAGDTRVDVGRFVFAGGNNITLSQGTAANALNTITISAAAQTNQTGGIYVTAQSTGQSSSSTYDLRTLSFVPDGIISAGWSNGSFRVSATQSNQAFSAAGGSSAFQTLGFSDNAAASFTNTNGSVAIASVRASLFATSNTTQSSSGTANLNSLIFAGAGIASVGVTNGSVVVSVPAGGGGGDGGVFAGVSTGGNTAGSTGTVSTGNFVLVGSNNITLSQSTGAAGSAATVTMIGPSLMSAGISNVGSTAGTSGLVASQIVFVGSNGLLLSQSVNGQSATITFDDGQRTLSMFQNLPNLQPFSSVTQTSGSSIFVQPFTLPQNCSVGFLRFLASFNDSAVGTAGTTSANTTFSVARYTTFGVVVYSQGVGANSRSIQSVTSSSGGLTGVTIYSAGAQGSQYTVTLQKTYPVTGGTSSYTTSYAVSSASIVVSSNSNTLFTGPRYLDLPFAVSLPYGNFWLGIGASTSSASNSSNISFAGTAGLPISLTAVSQSNVSLGLLGAATSASDHQLVPGLGVWTTNASNWSTGSIGLNAISQVVSNPQLFFQLLRSA